MKIRIDYLAYLKAQCNSIFKSLDGNYDNSECYKTFSLVCKNLSNDFLPPINREDIAAISYSLMAINREICRISDYDKKDFKRIVWLFSLAIEDVLKKKKTCEQNIRRLTEENYKLLKTKKQKNYISTDCLIKLIDDLIRVIINAYFKNI